MIKSRKFRICLLILLLALSSLLFVACGTPDYSSTYLTVSESYVQLFKDEEKNLTITINNPVNDMSPTLTFSISNANTCQLELLSQHNMTSTYSLKAKNGGIATIDFLTIDGGIGATVNVVVREYSSVLQPGGNELFVSSSTKLSPSSHDFTFDDNSTERNLKYYFYGKNNSNISLTINDILQGQLYINNFTDIKLYKPEGQNKSYLIFTDSDGFFHTLGKQKVVAGSGNVSYEFISVTNENGIYNFSSGAVPVNAGDKFSFITIYENALVGEPIYCEREFTVIVDIDTKGVSHEYGYKINEKPYEMGVERTSYKVQSRKNGDITLIPNYVSPITDDVFLTGTSANFLTAYVEVKIDNINEFLKVRISAKDSTIASATVLGYYQKDQSRIYAVQLNCGVGRNASTSLDVNIYYEGFETSESEKVNYTYSIPVDIHIKPLKLLVNSLDASVSSKIYTFYDNYASASFGWQQLNFTILPEGAEFTSLVVDLTESGLQVRYMGETYTTGELNIINVYEPIYVKGANEATITEENKKLPINLYFNVVKEDCISSYIEYSISKGPSSLDYKTESYKNKIYLERFSGAVSFTDIYTDAEFSSMTFTHFSGNDVVNLQYDARSPFIKVGDDFVLNISIIPKAVGYGVYTITLDNGRQITIKLEVCESLKTVSLATKDENNVIRHIENSEAPEGLTSLLYLYNAKSRVNFDLSIVANENVGSQAVKEIIPVIDSLALSLIQKEEQNLYQIFVEETGTFTMSFTINGYEIIDFERVNKSLLYNIKIVSFEFLEKLNVYKLSDGFGTYSDGTSASYSNVYSNTYNESARKLKIEVSLQNPNGYLFADPTTNEFVDNIYQNEFLYFESDARIYKNGSQVNLMCYSPQQTETNVYTIGNYGTFDTGNLTFTAFSGRATGKFKLIAHLKQYGKTYSYTINVIVQVYEVVERIQTTTDDLEFSTIDRQHSIIAYPTNKTATNGEIVAIFEQGELNDNGTIYKILDEDSISYLESDGKTYIEMNVSEDFLKKTETINTWTDGDLIIVAKDWLDNGGNLRSEFQQYAVHIKVRFANGSKQHRFTIKDTQDLISIRENLSAHYQISTTIDVSNVSSQFPLGELTGSIVGTNEYAIITNIKISNSSSGYYGVFTKIADDAFIEYVQFVGCFDIQNDDGESIIGMVAGENNGQLINVGAKISSSNIDIRYGSFGGLVGVNNGEIIQDFTLFECICSETRTKSQEKLIEEGRYTYQNKTPLITVQMTDYVNVYYYVGNEVLNYYIGGVVGYNNGTIKKVDLSQPCECDCEDHKNHDVSINGYTNYMAYTLIKSAPRILSITRLTYAYLGGLVGYASTSSTIYGGFNTLNYGNVRFDYYKEYRVNGEGDFEAGKGLIVGGEVWGYANVGGVVGEIANVVSREHFTGVTTRTYVRGQKVGSSIANTATIANIKVSTFLYNAFAIQAVDDGKLGEEASMIIIFNDKVDTLSGYLDDIDKLGFGNFEHNIDILNRYRDDATNEFAVNVFTYVISRSFNEKAEDTEFITVENASKESYYGDFIILGASGSSKVVLAQKLFNLGSNVDLSISQNFNNKMTLAEGPDNAKDVFYTYYFQASSSIDSLTDVATIQAELDAKLNKISVSSSIYPFIANGEMVFSSKTPDILTIDQVGKITLKNTGFALISATSVLNINNALNFYIYVVNYFNPETALEESERSSIIFNDLSASATPVDKSNISLRGNNNAEIFIRPRYDIPTQHQDLGITVDQFGKASFEGMNFILFENSNVTADVEITDPTKQGMLDIVIYGQSINIRKNSETLEDTYALTITPKLVLSIEGQGLYFANVNRMLTDTTINYTYGAISISNKNFNSVPLQLGNPIVDEITIRTTDENEGDYGKVLHYYIDGLDGRTLQGNVDGDEYQLDKDNFLFDVKFEKIYNDTNPKNGVYEHKFRVTISINTKSSVYTQRYNKEIYGAYNLYIQPETNLDLAVCIVIDFERTQISSVIVDNYKSLKEMEGTSLTSTSEYAYPGESGLLQITISPEDSDFDYVLIENDDQNYQTGKAKSNFGLIARNQDATGEGLFSGNIIWGSSIAKGIKLTQDEIIKAYSNEEFYDYNGEIYIEYNMSSKNVIDLSTSRINITFYKDGTSIYSTFKELKVKLKNFVGIEIDGKEESDLSSGYYRSYNVARGVKYKLNIDSFGFKQDNIQIKSSNPSLGQVTQENGQYYLKITEDIVDYSFDNEVFELIIEAIQDEGENIRQAESKTKITIFEYVFNYNDELNQSADIVKGTGDGVINIQVGSNLNLAIDMFDFVEYNPSVPNVVNSIQTFFDSLTSNGKWYAFTNLISDNQPDYTKAKDYDLNDIDETFISTSERKIYSLNNNSKNYYFENTGLKIMPLKPHLPEERFYYLGYIGAFKEENGLYVYDANGDSPNKITTTFVFNVYTTSSEKSPIPVYDYEDLCSMQKGGYYILLNDIILPNIAIEEIPAFTPLSGKFASFDGNGHSINFMGTYDMGSLTEIGLFKSLDENSVIKNLIVNYIAGENDLNTNANDTAYELYGLRTVKFVTTADSVVFGSIVAENSGIITNCQVFSERTNTDEMYLALKADNALVGSSYIGGVVGRNNGYITNCGVSLNIKSPFNIAGVVAQNYNKVAGCYFKEGKLINNSRFSQYVGGFALTNSQNGVIMTSYVAGAQSSANLYSTDQNSFIKATIGGAGFVYENEGKINDCYTDIDLSKTTSEMAGFVYKNIGNVRNSFSLSVLRNNTVASAGFVKENLNSLVNCYYYYHNHQSCPNDCQEGNINTSLYDQTFEGVTPLTREQFGNFQEYFSDYSYTDGMQTNSVWFVSKGDTSSNFVEYIPTTQKTVIKVDETEKSQSNTIYKTEIMDFGINRLELVSPNVRVLSIRNFDYSSMDEETGEVVYHYRDDLSTADRGSIHNPRLIFDADSMESEILNETSKAGLNTTNYRLISDINYGEFIGHSSLYKVIFAGNFEGNGMEISGISLVSMDKLSSAGLFAQIGYSQSKQGSIKNLIISPRAVSFNNAEAVGILAGTIQYGNVYDVTVEGVQGSSATVTGLRFVGGVFGKAETSFTIKDVYSKTNVAANYSPIKDDNYVEGAKNTGEYSYAGSIAGFVGKGKLYNAHVEGVNSIMGGRAGFAYGGIGKGADVQYTFVDVEMSSTIKPYQYGGYIAGEICGS